MALTAATSLLELLLRRTLELSRDFHSLSAPNSFFLSWGTIIDISCNLSLSFAGSMSPLMTTACGLRESAIISTIISRVESATLWL